MSIKMLFGVKERFVSILVHGPGVGYIVRDVTRQLETIVGMSFIQHAQVGKKLVARYWLYEHTVREKGNKVRHKMITHA